MVTIFSSEQQEKVEKSKGAEAPSNPDLPEGPFSPAVSQLISVYQDYYLALQSEVEEATLSVDEIASKVALFYEKIRKIVDWKEEHLVRRSAIERILKRKMISEISGISVVTGFDPQKIAEPLILELIRGGHFPNNKIPRKKIKEVQRALEKYTFILENNPLSKNQEAVPKIKKKINFYNWILEIAACEIEEVIEPPVRERALIDCMVDLMDERIRVVPQNALDDKEKKKQILIAVHRTLFHLDEPIISYHLLKLRWPQWHDLPHSVLSEIAQNILLIIEDLEKDLNHPFSGKFFNLCEKYDTLYLLLSDVLKTFAQKPEEMSEGITKPKDLITLVKKAYNKRLATLKSRLVRSAIYSTLSIFVAGAVSLYVFEVPLAKLVYGHWRPLAIVVDILLPTILMAILVGIIRPPRGDNLERVLKEIVKIVYESKEKDLYEIRVLKKKSLVMNFLIGFLYLLGTVASLGLIFWVFSLAKVPVTSLYIDTLNVAMIVFAALVIKQRAKELTVEERVSFWEFSLDILSVPMAKIGQWLSKKWKEYNIVSVFFIALIDMPFSNFIGFIENWRSFLKEKKAEIH
jgi:hypothetical protein